MDGKQTQNFSARLVEEMAVLSWQEKNDLLIRIGRMERRMRTQIGDERPVWKGPVPEADILGADVVVPTDQGERRGRVICFGILAASGTEYERSVVIHVPSSGTQHEALGSATRLASPEDMARIRDENAMAAKLAELANAVKRSSEDGQAAKQRKRGMKDPTLIVEMLELAKKSSTVSAIEEGGANHKIVGKNASRRLYLFKNQLRVDISGFSPDHVGIRKISDEEARDMHLGKVRGQLLFEDRTQSLSAFQTALDGLI